MKQKLTDALNEISDTHIAEAAQPRKKRLLPWLGAIAAVLAVVLVVRLLPAPIAAQAVSNAAAPRVTERPDLNDYDDRTLWREETDIWMAQRDARWQTADTAQQCLQNFFLDSTQLFLKSSDGGNRVWSPVNGYIALAMLAEVTGGTTRQQLLDLLNTPDLETLRTQASAVWESIYQDDGNEISVLANSLWLDSSLPYVQSCMDDLSYHYYADVYRGQMGSDTMTDSLHAWLNNHTGGLLKDSVNALELPLETVLTLASTVYLQSKWTDEFSESQNTTGVFHATDGDRECTYLNHKLYQTHYYWGDSYGAVSLGLQNGGSMWLFLPDEGKTVSDILSEGQYLALITDPNSEENENRKYMKVNISVPKFDIHSEADLKTGLQTLGITDVFDPGTADFSPSMDTGNPVWLDSVRQAARVAIDEEGVTAASYIVMPLCGSAAPPEDIIDFVLDRPFFFIIEKSGIPLFTGTVNQP